MKDNLERGSRLLFFLKFVFILLLILGVCAVTFFYLFGEPQNINQDSFMAMDILGISLILFSIGILLLLTIISILTFVFWINWFYRTIQNANYFSKTIFSPVVSILLSLIPGLGAIFHFFILNDLIRKTELWLKRQKIKHKIIKPSLINSWFILVLLCFVADFFKSDLIVLITSFSSFVIFISIVRQYIQHEALLIQQAREEEIRKQVEAVLEQREQETQTESL